ncbi:uncharacterized protein UV8b_07571 [Ustilaginoidea virens]|uniref:YCII-related domain-containing protein n=1 Tax=Ustilaginoidea virens TaxID=1159556 RepID=A0A8E5HXA4_USTVR|nr:uncharacterized protein UV8b_07571 [Ustilaginoidea virens]QUC23330.1 hypothetical protein UV8b_07571 [Ustilaginoidea virens]
MAARLPVVSALARLPRRRPSRPRTTLSARTMASAPSTREFLVIIPDKPGATAKRLQVRPAHLKNITPLTESGVVKMGGALLNSFPEGDDPATFDFMGSTVVFRAETKEQVLELLKQDVYSASGVWDIEKAQIYPFLCAFRAP